MPEWKNEAEAREQIKGLVVNHIKLLRQEIIQLVYH